MKTEIEVLREALEACVYELDNHKRCEQGWTNQSVVSALKDARAALASVPAEPQVDTTMDTPRTDAHIRDNVDPKYTSGVYVMAWFARQLERELAHACLSTHKQAFVIQQCGAVIGPDTTDTMEFLPNAVRALKARVESSEANAATLREACAEALEYFEQWADTPLKLKLRAAIASVPAEQVDTTLEAGECTSCGGKVYHRPNKPGEFDHQCAHARKSQPTQDEQVKGFANAIRSIIAEDPCDNGGRGDCSTISRLNALMTVHDSRAAESAANESMEKLLDIAKRISEYGNPRPTKGVEYATAVGELAAFLARFDARKTEGGK